LLPSVPTGSHDRNAWVAQSPDDRCSLRHRSSTCTVPLASRSRVGQGGGGWDERPPLFPSSAVGFTGSGLHQRLTASLPFPGSGLHRRCSSGHNCQQLKRMYQDVILEVTATIVLFTSTNQIELHNRLQKSQT